ncbi:MAG TPA: GDSL-type esterase/lipase family protein [Terriglobales bacterium]|jgi:lysophospholipase L1-like esterase|nr:GDSL-type esterase/lipase family protein [Terriglobales bacterium]
MLVSVADASTVKPVIAPKRKWPKRVLWFLGICLLLEIGLRPFGYGSYVIYRPDERLLWVPIPGTHKVTEMNHQPETISPQGFRYREVLTFQHPGVYRIFTFGDSTTMGWGVNDDSNYSARLENLLNSQGCSGLKFQVISAGVNAYPNALVQERMKQVLDDGYEPDAVVIAYSANTGFEGIPDLQGEQREKFLKKVALKSIARRSALYNFLIEDLLRGVAYYRFREVLMLGTWDTARSSPDLPVSHFLAKLEQAKAAADAHHTQMILLLLGSKNEPYPAHPYQQAMLDYAHANNVPLINIIDLMKSQDQNAVFMDHVHPTVKGHAMIAQQLAPVVRGLDSYAAACRAASNGGSSVTSLTAKPANRQQ